MRNFVLRLTTWSTVAVMLSLNFSYAAFAINSSLNATIASYIDNAPAGPGAEDVMNNISQLTDVLDSVVDESTGDIHVVGMGIDSDQDGDSDLIYFTYDESGGTWSAATVIEANIDTDNSSNERKTVDASIALNSSNYPAIAWQEIDITDSDGAGAGDQFTADLHYKQFSGASWDATQLVDNYSANNTNSPTTGQLDLEFYPNTTHPTIFYCNDVNGGIYQYKTSNQFSTVSNELQVSGDFCSAVDAVIDSSDVVYLLSGDHTQDKVRAHINSTSNFNVDGAWSVDGGDGTIISSVDSQNDMYLRAELLSGGEVVVAVKNDSNSAGANDSIKVAKRNGTSWGASSTAVSSIQLDENSEFDVTYDDNEGVFYIAYADLNSDTLAVAYDAGAGWITHNVDDTNYTSVEDAYVVANYNDYPASNRLEILANVSGTDMYLDHHQTTDLPSMATGGGGAVPEFSTYVYVATIMAVFGLLYKKNPEAFAFVNNK